MLKLPIFGKKKLLLAFEYGLILAKTAQEHKIELNADHVKRAEIMIEGEFRNQTVEHNAVNMIPNLLTVFEFDLSQ